MRALSILLLAATLFAADTYLRYGVGACYVTNATNASPPVLTCAAAHNIPSGTRVRLDNLLISGPAVSPLNRVAFAKSESATTISLWEETGLTTPLAAPGVWSNTGGADRRIGTAVVRTIPAMAPRVLSAETIHDFRCDTSDSCLTNISVTSGVATATVAASHRFAAGGGIGVFGSATGALNTITGTVTSVTATTIVWSTAAGNGTYTDAGISSRAFTANVAWGRLQLGCAEQTTPYYPPGYNEVYGEWFEACAYWYFVDRTQTGARDKALWMIQHPEYLALYAIGGSHSVEFLGNRYSTDTGRGGMAKMAVVYNLLRLTGDISGALQTEWSKKVFTDRYNTPACVEQTSLTALTGTSISFSGTTVTGVGTAFSTQLAVGSVLWPNGFGDDYSFPWIVTAIASNTSLTVHRSGTFSGSLGQGFTRPWADGDCGLSWYFGHHTSGPLGDPAIYPPNGSQGGIEKRYHNLGATSQWSHILAATAGAGDSTLAANILERAWLASWDNQLAFHVGSDGGGSPYGATYEWWRSQEVNDIADVMQRVWNIDVRGNWMLTNVRFAPYSFSGGAYASAQAFFNYYGDSSLAVAPSSMANQIANLDNSFVTDEQRRIYYAMVAQYCGGSITSACFSDSQSRGASFFFRGYNPQLAAFTLSTLPKALAVRGGNPELCAGALNCAPTSATFDYAVSRSGWTGDNEDSKLHVCGGTWTNDHGYDCAGAWWLQLGGYAGSQPHFVGDDHSTGSLAAITSKNHIELSAHTRKGGVDVSVAQISTAQFSRSHVGANLFHVRVDSRGTWITAPTRSDTDFMHFKRSGQDEFVVVRRHIIASAGTINARKHWTQNGQAGEGATTCAGSACAAGTITGIIRSANATHRVLADAVYPDSAKRGRRYRDNSDGTYTGGNGFTDRHSTCATANDTTCNASATALLEIDVNRIGVVADGTTLPLVSKSVSGFDGVQAAGPGGGNILAMFATTTDQASMPTVTTSVTTDIGVTGLTAGTYKVQRDTVDVSGCGGQVVTSTDNAVGCTGVLAGDITVVLDAGAPATSGSRFTGRLAGGARIN